MSTIAVTINRSEEGPSCRRSGTESYGVSVISFEQQLVEWMLSMDMGRKSQRIALFGLFGVGGITKEQGEEALASLHESLQKLIREYRAEFPESIV